MNALRQAAVRTLILVAAVPFAALGQENACAIDLDSPNEVKNAYRTLTLMQVTRPDDAPRQLQAAVKGLTDRPERIKNQAGRSMVLGQSLVMWVEKGGAPLVTTRGSLGYVSSPEAPIDVYAAADSAFDAVEQAMPQCASETAAFRRRAWGSLVNQAGELINQEKLDTAEVLINKAHAIYDESPYGYYYLAGVHQRREEHAATIEALRKALELATPELAAEDTNLKEVREYATYSIGATLLRQAEAAEGEQQKTLMNEAASSFRQYLKEYPQGPNAGRAQQGLISALEGSGDTTAVASMRQDMIANAANYTDLQLLDAGTEAFNAKRYDEAASLLEKALEKNQYYVQTLYTLATTYGIQSKFDKMLPVARRLVEVAPNSSENLDLLALAYSGVSQAAKQAQQKKLNADSANVYADRAQQLKVKVAFNRFIHDGPKHMLGGSVENLGAAAKTVPMKVEFLDPTGRVVATQETQVQVPAKGKAEFSVEVQGEGIAAFRYAPIT